MVQRGELPEPRSAAHLANLEPLKRVGGKMSKEACQDPAKAKYIGECCGGRRAWGELGADIYIDDKDKRWAVFCCGACKAPLPWLPLPPTSRRPRRAVSELGSTSACRSTSSSNRS